MAETSSSGLPAADPAGTESSAAVPAHLLVDSVLAIDREGHWLYRGEPVRNERLISWLWRQLRCTAEGDYWVVNGPQRAVVAVADAPFLVSRLERGEDGTPWVVCAGGDREPLAADTLRRGQGGALYAGVLPGRRGAPPGARHRARLSRQAVLDLEPWLVERDGAVWLRVGEAWFAAPI